MNPSNADIRQFILDSFNDDDFEIFYTDYFRDALAEFGSGMSLRIRALRLIEYCQRRELVDHLLSALQAERAQLYAQRFAPTAAPPPSQPPTQTPMNASVSQG